MFFPVNRAFLLSAAIGWSCISGAQQNPDNMDKMVDFLPPAPNAAAIAKHAALTLNKNTGTPNFSIPLFTIKSKSVTAPVSISYSSAGIKVDEIASRAGMGWVLTAGGVITRTMRGTPDEVNPRRRPWSEFTFNWSTYNYCDTISQATNFSGYDSEPDLFTFSFNGNSGSFVFDDSMRVLQLRHSTNKIYHNFTSTDWNFKIIDGSGIIYYFGGTGRTEKTKREQICGKLFDTYLTTAWYIKKIEHPNGDKIEFNYTSHDYQYDNGVTQSMYKAYANTWTGMYCDGVTPCTGFSEKTCINLTKTQGVLLNEIVSPNHSKIKFYYISRTDCEDKLVSKVEYINARDNSTVGFFNFVYNVVTSSSTYTNGYATGHDKTPYLYSLIENNADSSEQKKHLFTYHKPAQRPPRLSYSQDHWGYFNGVVNTSFIPVPELRYREHFPNATASREPNGTFARLGMLAKIVYPTGGMDSIIYESNQAAIESSVNPLHNYTCSVTGTGTHTQVTKSFAFDAANQTVELNIACINNGGADDTLHHKGRVEILNSSSQVVFSELMSPGQSFTRYVLLISSGNYTLKLYANGTPVTTQATLKRYTNTVNPTTAKNMLIGGVRVSAVLTQNPYDSASIKKYYYGSMDSLDLASQTFVQMPKYARDFKNRKLCVLTQQGAFFYIFPQYCSNTALSSNSLVNLFDYQSSPVSYHSVVESDGENFENGGVVSTFYSGADALGQSVWQDFILNAPMSNFAVFLNGRLKDELTLKRSASGALIPLKKTINHMKIDPRIDKTIYGYTVNKKYEITFTPDTTCNLSYFPENATACYDLMRMCAESYDVTKYQVMTSWSYPDTTWEIAYDQNGQNPLTSRTIFYYDNDQHLQITRIDKLDSKQNLLKTLYKYPHDYTGNAVYDSMIAKNMIEATIDAESYVNTNETNEVKTNFATWGNNNYQPASFERSVSGGTMQNEGTIDYYDALGNVLQYTAKNGIVTAVIWGYNNTYPVAKITGATYSQCKNQLSVDTSQLQSMTGDALLTELNRIRTNLPSAQVTTYTYKHLVGVTSITDPANRRSSYTYDAFNRLQLARDQDSNIVKKLAYSHATPDTAHSFNIYYNNFYQQAFYIQGCQAGYVAGQVYFSVPTAAFISVKSQSDADALAEAYVQANGQLYANKYGVCDNTLPCTGIDRKLVDCLCKLAIKMYTDTYQNQNGTWTCVYHWHYADNTNSQSFTEINSSPCYGGD